MAVAQHEDTQGGDQDFLQQSHLSYIVPYATDFDIEQVLREGEDSHKALFESIEQRPWLFFGMRQRVAPMLSPWYITANIWQTDETVDIYLILRTVYKNEAALRSYLARVVLTLEAQIVNSHAGDREHAPATEVIHNGTVPETEDPLIVVDQADGSEDDDGEEQHVHAIWKLPVFLARPRLRLQGPSVTFTASAALKPAQDASAAEKDGYLASRTPSGMNLLDAFASDQALGGVKPRLSAQRVSKVAPVTQSRSQHRPIKGLQHITLKIYPALHTRVRFARPNTVPSSPTILAMLEIDFTPFFDCEALLSKIDLFLPSGVITDLNQEPGLALPLSCVAHDHITYLYRLAPQERELDPLRNPTQDLDIKIEVSALVKPGLCTPKLTMSWITPIDFTPPVNPGFGTPIANPSGLQRAHRPSQLSIDGSASLTAPAVSRPDALPALEAATARTPETAVPDFGITMTFAAPQGPVYAGEEFSWTVFVVNRTSPSATGAAPGPGQAGPIAAPPAPRKLALFAIPRRHRRNDAHRTVRPPSRSGRRGPAGSAAEQIADAVLDENVVHAMQRTSLVDAAEVVCLSSDTRVGPLAPGACHVVELRFLALKAGVVGVEAIRVVDLGSQEHVDVRELPIMVVEERGQAA
ncbi:uncharacterized protein E0L32_011079 [Thyridium curvatum]|uniref:Trafficking protein particle complex II-specific subunit 65 IgD3 domain-containing protein n=1 Tax=Thyridium curvatum TaxID=1093900 RepID=A0A507AQ85_9PEZI|nr:uncharacterized protein E0L32_011079 [Thyridium curvatum]TPX07011.1 hypothetical protein E0L32_011079 [Thyridium curvatum]